jgi:hypothetical protein
MWANRYFSRYVLLAIMLVFWHAALPYLHMAAANRPGEPILICTGSGVQILFSVADASEDSDHQSFKLTSKTLPCVVSAHANCLLPGMITDLVTASSDWVSLRSRYIPTVTPQLFRFTFARGGAPPNLS